MAQPRAVGQAMLSAKRRGAQSVLGELRQSGSLKLMFPRPSGPMLDAVLVNTAGGVTGGDRFDLCARAEADTVLSLTTQAAERAYRAQPGQVGQVRNRLDVAQGARLNWLPQETLLFQGCAFDRHLEVALAADARLLLCETVVFGRAAMGEVLSDGHFHDRIDIYRDGVPLFCDATRLDGEIARHLARPTIAGGAGAMTALLLVAPEAETHLDALRAALGTGSRSGVSLIHPDVLFARFLAPDSFALRQILMPLLRDLSGVPLPRPWMI